MFHTSNFTKSVVAVLAYVLVSSSCEAQDGRFKETVPRLGIDDNGNLDYFSQRLGARFRIQHINVPGYGTIRAARISSQPEQGSPLQQLGLRAGDVITRLDGTPVTSKQELERHILETTVRYIKAGTQSAREGQIYIDQYMSFQDPYHSGNSTSSGILPP